MTETEIANGARGEVTFELGGETYLLKPEFGIIARIQRGLDPSLFERVMKTGLFGLRVREMLRTIQVVLAANGYQRSEQDLAEAIAQAGVGPVLVPLLVFLRGYVWGGAREKKDPQAAPANGQSPGTTPQKTPVSSANGNPANS